MGRTDTAAGPQLGRRRIAILHVAKSQLGLAEADYRALLRRAADVASSKDLDAAGFDAVMAEFARLGFTSTAAAERVAEKSRRYSHSTYAQRQCISAKWESWRGRRDDASLNRWLERHFNVSALRFLSRDVAAKAIAALGNFPPRDPSKIAASRKNDGRPSRRGANPSAGNKHPTA